MKIVHQGSELEVRKKAWWVGLKVECNDCTHKVELEWVDRELVNTKLDMKSSKAEVFIVCPICHKRMSNIISIAEYMILSGEAEKITPEQFAEEQSKLPI